MNLSDIFGEAKTVWLIIPLLIFLARIIDVSIGTVRLIFVARGMRLQASILGVFEVLIWLATIGQILQNLTGWQNYVAYGLGFGTGNYIGMLIEDKLALGNVILRVITRSDASELVGALRERQFGVTSVDADGRDGPVTILFTLTQRQNLPVMIDLVNKFNPRAFYSIEDVRYVREGVFPTKRRFFRIEDTAFRRLLGKRK